MTMGYVPVSGAWMNGTAAVWTFGIPADLTIVSASLDHSFSATGPSDVVWQVNDEGALRESCVLSTGACAAAARSVRFPSWQGRNTPVACAPGINGAITAGLPKRRSATQKRAKAARIRGTAPGGAQLRLISRVSRRGDGAKAVGATVTAGANGRYSLPVPKGPSRSLRVGWRRAGEPDFACSRSLSLRVRSRISLSAPRSIPASLPRATFRGRLRGGYVPKKGKLVLLQGRQPGRSWRTFRAVHTNRTGRFSTRYRFSGARGTFRVRARVPGEAVYPFTPASSRVVRVRVR